MQGAVGWLEIALLRLAGLLPESPVTSPLMPLLQSEIQREQCLAETYGRAVSVFLLYLGMADRQ